MKRLAAFWLVLMVLAAPAWGVEHDPLGTPQAVDVTSSPAVSLTNIPSLATRAIITCETASVRWWPGISTPTTSAGHILEPGGGLILDNRAEIEGFKAIAVSTSGKLMVSYYR